MEEKIYTVDELRALVRPLLERHGMAEARLFGSYARGEADERSDIDILLTGKPGFRPLSVYGVSADLRQATGKSVDVYEVCELDPGPFRDEIMREAVLL